MSVNQKDSEPIEGRYKMGQQKRLHPPIETRQGIVTSPHEPQKLSNVRLPRGVVHQSAKIRKSERMKKESSAQQIDQGFETSKNYPS